MTRIIFPLVLTVAALAAAPVAAQTNAPAAESRATQPVRIADNAPDVHVVVPGDTLWGISGRFLAEPWRWPEVWRLNREQIANPHLIYPGQVIMLDRSGPYLTIGQRLGDDKLSPRVYTEKLSDAIPSLPPQLIAPFLTQPLVVDDGRLDEAGTVIATETSRVFMGKGDTVFAKDVLPGGARSWQVFRPAKPLNDPYTGELLGYEAQFLGSAEVTEYGSPSTLQLTSAVEEIGTGDRLLPAEEPQVFAYVPQPTVSDLEGRIIGIYRGVAETGRHNVVTLNVGSFDGVAVGHVVALYRHRGIVEFKGEDGKEAFELPDKRFGLGFVFRVFDRVAYALVMDSDGQVSIGDWVRAP